MWGRVVTLLDESVVDVGEGIVQEAMFGSMLGGSSLMPTMIVVKVTIVSKPSTLLTEPMHDNLDECKGCIIRWRGDNVCLHPYTTFEFVEEDEFWGHQALQRDARGWNQFPVQYAMRV